MDTTGLTTALFLLACLLGVFAANENYMHAEEAKAKEKDKAFYSRRWHWFDGASFWTVIVSLGFASFYHPSVGAWFKIYNVLMFAAAGWVSFTISRNLFQGSDWYHVGSNNTTDKIIRWTGNKLRMGDNAFHMILIIAIGAAAIWRLVWVFHNVAPV